MYIYIYTYICIYITHIHMYMYTCTYVHIHIHIHMHVYTYMKHAWEPPSLTTGPLTGVGLAALESPAVEIRLIRVPTCD